MWGELYETEVFSIRLNSEISPGEGNRLLRELGAVLHCDVYDFPAESTESWQSESLLAVTLLRSDGEVDAQEAFDAIELTYFFATRPSSDQQSALDLMENIAARFGGRIINQNRNYDRQAVLERWDQQSSELLREWGEEPGSFELRRMIEENYPK